MKAKIIKAFFGKLFKTVRKVVVKYDMGNHIVFSKAISLMSHKNGHTIKLISSKRKRDALKKKTMMCRTKTLMSSKIVFDRLKEDAL